MFVESDVELQNLIRERLKRSGYRVLESKNPGEALQVAARHTGSIQLLLTDVVMPQMNGRQLAERLAPLRPDMKVLYMSGYTEDVFRRGILEPGIALVEKPLTPELLARRVREILDEAPSVTREQTAG